MNVAEEDGYYKHSDRHQRASLRPRYAKKVVYQVLAVVKH